MVMDITKFSDNYKIFMGDPENPEIESKIMQLAKEYPLPEIFKVKMSEEWAKMYAGPLAGAESDYESFISNATAGVGAIINPAGIASSILAFIPKIYDSFEPSSNPAAALDKMAESFAAFWKTTTWVPVPPCYMAEVIPTCEASIKASILATLAPLIASFISAPEPVKESLMITADQMTQLVQTAVISGTLVKCTYPNPVPPFVPIEIPTPVI